MRSHHLRRFGALLVAFGLVACGGGGGGSATPPLGGSSGTGPPPLPVIPEVTSVNGVAALTLTAQFDQDARPAFFYNGIEVAPTIRVSPGDTIKIHFINDLPAFCAPGVATDSNLHFHGFTTSPNQPSDDVIDILTPPGGSYDYTVQVNPDQPPGLYWYHTHPHGLSSWEVGNGMAGAIVVEGIANYVPATAGLRERVIILRDVPNDSSLAAGESARLRRIAFARRSPSDDDESGGNSCAPETDATPTINGLQQASIGIRPGETELFRVVNASGHRHFDLSFNGQPITIVAQDGVPISTYPGAPQTIVQTDVVVPPAGRVEFLVQGKGRPTPIVSKCFNSGPAGDLDPQITLGQLADDSTWSNPDNTTTQQRVRKPIAGLRRSQYYATTMPPPAQQRTVTFTEDANGFYLNGQQYSPSSAPMFVAQHGTTEEWNLVNASGEVHDFHIHQVHFIIESVNGVPVANPHWFDTIVLPPEGVGVQGQLIPSQTKVLLDFRDPVIVGTFVFHCHILDHEDGGMMAKIQVQ
ncbi:MAG TPA: multicopper oxidase family protein [Candidatus Sulfotelmatobacter sp.]|nr:multicopper oxidase family protein [Candidatus Sulfotelmatobacter sp.]